MKTAQPFRFRLLYDRERILQLDTQIPNLAVLLRVPKKELHSRQIDRHCLQIE